MADRCLVVAAQAVLLAYGLFASLRIVLEGFGPDPDTVHSLLLWHGVREHGLPWLASWTYTQDNWLLSLVPFHFAGYAVFGATPWVSIGGGWLIFVLAALVAAAIVAELGARRAATLVFLALINVGPLAHLHGFAAYSTSHNVTNLFGLASMLVLIHWARRPRASLLGLVLVLLTAGAISDPWMLAAFNLPIALAALVVFVRPGDRITRPRSAALLAVAAFSMIATRTKLFRALGFLPSVEFAPAGADQVIPNGLVAIDDVGGLLNIVPIPGQAGFVSGLVSVIAVVAFVAWRTATLVRERRFFARLPLLFVAIVVLSIGGVVAALMLSNFHGELGVARFALNGLYLAVIAIAVLSVGHGSRTDGAARRIGLAFFALFVASSVAGTAASVTRPGFAPKDVGVDAIADFLRSHDLTYGFGPYWGSLGNAVTASTNGAIRIRPVMFSRISGVVRSGRPETSSTWYTDDDVPAGTRRFFVIVMNDGEECPVVATCVAGVERQFGAPVERLTRKDMLVLVWDRPLRPRPP